MRRTPTADAIVIGAGIAGIATAWSLARRNGDRKTVLVDALSPMSFTSAQSGENYRNWWPHPLMTGFIDHSLDLLEQVVKEAGGDVSVNRRGYALATRREEIGELLHSLHAGYGGKTGTPVRQHDHHGSYERALSDHADGVDVCSGQAFAQEIYPAFDPAVRHVFHVRRAGDIDSYALAQHMLKQIRAGGGMLLRGEVSGIDRNASFRITLTDGRVIDAGTLVIAAGPFVNHLLAHLGERLPVRNVLQQKFAFEDTLGAVPRDQPFAVDLDEQQLDWSDEEREWLAGDEQYSFLIRPMPGNVHRRIDGGQQGRWLSLGWAYNEQAGEPAWSPPLDERFPEIVMRAASHLNPTLKPYIERMPAARRHYGGYYTMTDENLPIIGPLPVEGAFVVAGLSGFGTMAACAAGDCCARWISDAAPMPYARRLSLARYDDASFMQELAKNRNRGVL